MDDARVTRVSKEDVMAAEAYMLFYNVVNHPVSDELKKSHRAMTAVDSKPLQTIKTESISEEKKIDSAVVETMSGTKRKREGPSFRSGEDWARKMTTRPKLLLKSIRAVQEYFSSLVRLKPEYVQSMKEEIESGAKAGSGPSFGISGDDVENKGSIESGIVKIIKTILPKDHEERKALFREQNGSSKTEKSICIEPNESQGQSSSQNLIIPVQNQTDNLI
jgi:DNA-directed RNA polymerase subunit F